MRLLITIIFVFIGSILVGSTIHQLSAIGNGVLRLTGAALIIGAVYSFNKGCFRKDCC
jgi:hypothetical protein